MGRRRKNACGGYESHARGERGCHARKKKFTHENSLRRTTVIVERLPGRAVDADRVVAYGK
jgi:hypothetical protein